MIEGTQESRNPARDASLATIVSSAVFFVILSIVHIYEWQVYAAFAAFCLLLWPLWYFLFQRRIKAKAKPVSLRVRVLISLLWLVAATGYSLDIYQARRPLPDQIAKLTAMAIPAILQFCISAYYLVIALRERRANSMSTTKQSPAGAGPPYD